MVAGHRGNEEALDHWATETAAGEAHFAWGTRGDFERCVVFHEDKGLSPDEAKGHCANLHHRALGVWPGQEHGKKAEGMDTVHGWVPILKQEKQADGTLIVEGLATDSGIDRDQQIADPNWLSKAMPEWFSSGGNIREQHDGKRAAGVAVEYTPGDDGHRIRAHIVDSETVKKIEHGVLRGFSFGARNARVTTDKSATGGRIVDGQIYEVSVVDRPANPRCTLTIAKADDAGDLQLVDEPELVEKDDEPKFTPSQFADLLKSLGKAPVPVEKRDVGEKERSNLADQGKALPDGGFPIKNVGDLKNAIQAIGRAKDPATAKALIRRRAQALGREDLIPDSWGSSSKADGEQVHDPAEIAAVRDGLIALINAELDELANGEDELCDVTELLCALKMLMCWWDHEAAEGETDDPYPNGDNEEDAPMATIQLAEGATETAPETPETPPAPAAHTEVAKTETAETEQDTAPAPETPTDPAPAVEKADNTDAFEDAITKAIKPLQDELTLVKGELAKVLETPQAGGPVRTRTTQQAATAAKADGLRTEVAHCQRLIPLTSGDVQKGYRMRLDAAEDELAKLDGATV